MISTAAPQLFQPSPPKSQSPFHKGYVIAAGGDNVCEEVDNTVLKKSYEPNQQLRRSLNFSGEKPSTPVLDTVNYPIHMKNLSIQELEELADELREEIVYSVSKTGGHLSSSLGVAELTVALHHVFNTPPDRIIWDVGHQIGFPKRDESVHDAFGVGHSSTSISAGLGMAVARDLIGSDNHVISVIGDGAITGGQAFEAMNNAGFLDTNLIIILNENEQVSLPTATVDGPAPPVGALSRALARLHTSSKFHQPLEVAKSTKQIESQAHQFASQLDSYIRGMVGGADACLFEELEAEVDEKIVPIHAAMGGGTGLNLFQKRFPERCFDVGIAEQHAVTFAAGLAAEGCKPFCAIYSSFLQRGYDQVPHDVDLQKLPVRFALDRAGLVGADGPTHCGAFDTTFMACLPNMVVMAPSDETELMHMIAIAAAIDDRPSCFRYPRGYDHGISTTVVDARFCKPLDGDLMRQLAREHEILIAVEEGSVGGFGSHVSHFLGLNVLLDGNLKWRAMTLPDMYINHGSLKDQIAMAGLSSNHIAATALSLTNVNWDSRLLLNLQI
ncbi:hypothetical protein VNO80_22225 [Phaseolus coccineus]|uniref:1-deoxy-D-xylulose-5-phosphate synthase n=1 Tax=Phaseolus coccineus TaxID=3886 RepID=A0AAN9QTS9_PHACN